jgi:hypothetical protein
MNNLEAAGSGPYDLPDWPNECKLPIKLAGPLPFLEDVHMHHVLLWQARTGDSCVSPHEHAADSGFTITALELSAAAAAAAMGFETTPHDGLERKPSYNWLESLPPYYCINVYMLDLFSSGLVTFCNAGNGDITAHLATHEC